MRSRWSTEKRGALNCQSTLLMLLIVKINSCRGDQQKEFYRDRRLDEQVSSGHHVLHCTHRASDSPIFSVQEEAIRLSCLKFRESLHKNETFSNVLVVVHSNFNPNLAQVESVRSIITYEYQ